MSFFFKCNFLKISIFHEIFWKTYQPISMKIYTSDTMFTTNKKKIKQFFNILFSFWDFWSFVEKN